LELVQHALPASNLDVVLVFGWEYLQTSSPSSRARFYPSPESRPTMTVATGNTSASLTLGSSVLMFEDGLSSACLL